MIALSYAPGNMNHPKGDETAIILLISWNIHN